jgi:hypothetical protein
MAPMPAATTSRRADTVAWSVAALVPMILVAAGIAAISAGRSTGDATEDIVGVGLVFSICCPVLGNTAANAWARTALAEHSLAGWRLASWFVVWSWIPGWMLATTLLPVLFPDGRPTGRRRLLAWIDLFAVALFAGAVAAAAWQWRGPRLVDGSGLRLPAVLDHVEIVGFPVVGMLTVVSIGSLLARYRRAAHDVRRQIAWAVYGVAVAVILSIVGAFVDIGGLIQVLEAGALVGGLAIAMLRYRLYDIDVVINRTLVYGSLTVALAGVYLVSVLLMQLVLSPSSSVAVAVSTLGVAAVFRPAQAAIQSAVDRRFYRRRYDAGQTLAQFGSRLRDRVDLRALDAELREVVRETLHPARVSVWLRPPEARR